ncbi:Cytochrome P450 family protein [Coccidioides posadasii C735 delta SOWgp]|uniref:Cytochrome P450 family protein n=1 Tax=Coccidioides posadasii (strain C735) TaxID=222929 RepID=C5P0W4_COCP7|nr:Cytochrome P450 family protein [Coccidioides posadasii C735 delta SOWgp]EER29322.1 Cytochrome P450 family protein [Coccidioides posadasii C735 delta SOWgp]|eukprot:XP_003071467.1 Cytochrome P450 family protein [Coccidioides posadasii C735 delta SOWgp]
MDCTFMTPCAVAGGVGVLSHLLYFIRGEHHKYAHRWITRIFAGITVLAVSVLRVTEYQFLRTLILTILLSTSYFVGLYGSIGIYRIFFHPLRKFKGPFWARASNLYHMCMIRKSDNYLVMKKLHKQYGPIIRTGPANLSINDPAAIPIVLSDRAKCFKGPWYDRSLPLVNLHTVRDKKVHDARRKVFSKAFTPTALREYEERVMVHCEEFVRQMNRLSGKPFDASEWFKYFGTFCLSVYPQSPHNARVCAYIDLPAFDVMGDLGLGKEFHMMTTETNRWIPTLLETSMKHVGPTSPVPWMAPILHKMPWAGKGARAWLEFVGSQVKQRTQKKSDKRDILSHLIDAYDQTEKKDIDYQWLRGDTRLTIVGGSDTTAATLTFLFYHLAKDPSQVEKLRAELEPLLNGKPQLDPKDVSKAQHLNGVIQETLRLHPAIPSGFPRVTPPEGVTISGTYIPGGTTIVIPLYTMQRDEANYANAEEFIPERWYSKPELIKNRDAFLTWNIGTNGCIGRALALTEMRNLITYFIRNFSTVRFAPGEDGTKLVTETKDHFTVGVKPLHLIFE